MAKNVTINQTTLKTGFLLVTTINALNNANTESTQNKICVMLILNWLGSLYPLYFGDRLMLFDRLQGFLSDLESINRFCRK